MLANPKSLMPTPYTTAAIQEAERAGVPRLLLHRTMNSGDYMSAFVLLVILFIG